MNKFLETIFIYSKKMAMLLYLNNFLKVVFVCFQNATSYLLILTKISLKSLKLKNIYPLKTFKMSNIPLNL